VKTPITIIGGGLAGITAACYLKKTNTPFLLLEAAPQLGGRARTITHNNTKLDNGQHLLIGAYKETNELLNTIGINPKTAFHRTPFNWHIPDQNLHIQLPKLPNPWAKIIGMLTAKGLTLKEKKALNHLMQTAKKTNYQIQQDTPFINYLNHTNQTQKLIQAYWNPLTLGALCTPVEKASTQIMLNILKETFQGPRTNSDWLIPKQDLSTLINTPAQNYIKSQNIKTNTRITQITPQTNNYQLTTQNNQKITTQKIIIATTPTQAQNLLKPLNIDIPTLEPQPIPPNCRLKHPITGNLSNEIQWLIDRYHTGQPGLIAAITSGKGPYLSWPKEKWTEIAHETIKQTHPTWPNPTTTKVIKEKQAGYTHTPEAQKNRPTSKTTNPNIWLAGDYTQTHLPATIESAIKSGKTCAQNIQK